MKKNFITLLCLLCLGACTPHHTVHLTSPEPRQPGMAGSHDGSGNIPPAAGQSAKTRPYVLKGKRYVPVKTAHGYSEVGTASWYGAQFHGKPTANGERFNKNALTAAHPLLPLGSVVSVTNLTNGKTVNVRINDRGPFTDSRVIDLSKAAAAKLDMLDSGLTRVRIQGLSVSDNSNIRQNPEPFGQSR